jgi:recombinase
LTRCWGYDPKGLTVVESEAAEIRRTLIDGLLDGKKARAVVADLRKRSVLTATGGQWTESALVRFAQYPRLAGLQWSNGALVEAPWPAIITRDQHDQLVTLLSDPSREQPTDNKPKYLLSGGLLTCGNTLEDDGGEHLCAKPLYTQPSKTVTRGYVCRSSGPSYGCGRIRVSGPAIEDMVAARVLARLSSKPVLDRLKRAVGAIGDDFSIDDAMNDLDQRLKEAGQLYAQRELSLQTLKAIDRQTRQEREALRERARQAERLLKLPDPETLAEWWVDAPVSDRRELISLVLKHVVVKPAPRRGNIPLDPERLEFVWK